MLAQHDKLSLNQEFSQFIKALQHIFNQKRLVPLQWDILWWLFPMAKKRESGFPTSAMLYTFAVLLSSKSFALYLFCSVFNAQWWHELCRSAGWCCNTTCLTERWYFCLKFIQDIHCFAAIGPTLEDIKQRLSVADGKKNTLQIDLVTLQNNLNGINRGQLLTHHFCFASFIYYYKNLHMHLCIFQMTLTASSPVQRTW